MLCLPCSVAKALAKAVVAVGAPEGAVAALEGLVRSWASRQVAQCAAAVRAAAGKPAPQLGERLAQALLAGIVLAEPQGGSGSGSAVAALEPQAAVALGTLLCEVPSCRSHLDAFATAVLGRPDVQEVLAALLRTAAVQHAFEHSPAVLHKLASCWQAHLSALP